MALFSTGTSSDRLSAGTEAQRPTLAAGDAGSIRFNTDTGQMEQWDGTAWGPLGGAVTVSTTAPSNPNEGELWYNTNDSRLYAAVDDVGGTPVWVDASPDSQNVYWDQTAGILSPLTTTDGLSVAGATSLTGNLAVEGTSTFNDLGADVDFRVEGDTDTDLLFVDAGSDVVAVSADATEVAALVANNADVKLYVNGDATMTSQNGGPLAGFRNQIINGDFRIAQRGDDFFSSNPGLTDDPYTLDRWRAGTFASATPTRIARQNNDAPPGFDWSVALYGNGSPAGGTRQALLQGVELSRTGSNGIFAVGSTWTFSFWVKGTTGESIGAALSFRADVGTGGPSGEETSQTISLTPTWTKHSLTWTIATTVDASDTCLAATFFNAVASSNAVLIAGVQLEPGPVATPFEHRPMQTELALCQRYYYSYDSIECPGGANRGLFMTTFMGGSATRSGCSVTHPQTMRIIPTVSNLLVRDNPNASTANDTTTKYFIVTSDADNSGSNRYPAINTFECDAEL